MNPVCIWIRTTENSFWKVCAWKGKGGKTIVMAAQHPTDFPRDCGRLLLLKEGKVAFEGTAQEFLKGEHHRKIWNSNKRSPVPGW
jgi:ABC-type multidrug transport system ATPase subunit